MGDSIRVETSSATPAQIVLHAEALMNEPLSPAAQLWVFTPTQPAIAIGAFQRGASLANVANEGSLVRRASGGPACFVGPGTIWMQLALASPSSLTPCDPSRIVNRYVRPLLRGLTKAGATAHYFGRDWISVDHRPAGEVVFAHDSRTGRTLVEAIVGVSSSFALGRRESFLGKEPGSLESITGRSFEMDRLVATIAEAYPDAYKRSAIHEPFVLASTDAAANNHVRLDPPWRATIEEAIGQIGAGPDVNGRFRVGGDWLVSRDAVTKLEDAIAAFANPTEADLANAIDTCLTQSGVALDGIRSLRSVLDVIQNAMGLAEKKG